MVDRLENPDLRQINAYKKKLTWGEVPLVYSLASGAVSELDGLISHGFDSAYRQILDKSTWNLSLLKGHQDNNGEIHVLLKPRIQLKHVYTNQCYELHCFPMIDDEPVHQNLSNHPGCPFKIWAPESLQMLFRVNHLISFITYSFQKGDEADMALIRFSHLTIIKLIDHLAESFEIVDVIGYNIAEFCKEIKERGNPPF